MRRRTRMLAIEIAEERVDAAAQTAGQEPQQEIVVFADRERFVIAEARASPGVAPDHRLQEAEVRS